MRPDKRRPTWPFLFVLLGLFVLSVAAPRSWEKVARKSSLKLPPMAADRDSVQPMPDDHAATHRRGGQPTPARPSAPRSQAGSSATAALGGSPDDTGRVYTGDERHGSSGAPLVAEPGPAVAHEVGSTRPFDWADGTQRIALRPTNPRPADLTPAPATPHDPFDDLLYDEQWQLERSPDELSGPRLRVETIPVPFVGLWQAPSALIERLVELKADEHAGAWATRTIGLIEELTGLDADQPAEARGVLAELRHMEAQVASLLERIGRGPAAGRLARARYALLRHLDAWEPVAALVDSGTAAAAPTTRVACPPDPGALETCLAQVDALFESAPEGAPWRDYLLLDALSTMARRSSDQRAAHDHQLARQVLKRLASQRMTEAQRRFITAGPLAALHDHLREWASEPIEATQFLAELARYEQSSRVSDARIVAATLERLTFSPLDDARRLAERVDHHYRNANFRASIHADLLARLLPQPGPTFQPVRERVQGSPVVGNSVTSTRLDVRLIPDDSRLRLALVARGQMLANTSLLDSLATLRSNGRAQFEALKLLELTTQGILASPTLVDAQSRLRLTSVDTDLDPVPLVGSLAQSLARQQFDQQRFGAQRRIEQRVRREAGDRFEVLASQQIDAANARFEQQFIEPLERMSLGPHVVALRTTPERLLVRLRLASDDQLGSHTPRPAAPADSLLSVQLHESAMNNVFAQLELDGRQFSFGELHRWIGEVFNREVISDPDSIREEVEIRFAPSDSVWVRANDDRLDIRIHVAELRKDADRWRNFTVRAVYLPDPDVPAALVREGTIELIDLEASTRGQIAVRSVFSKMFSRERRWHLLPARLVANPQLADLEVTQFVLRDGWIGLAMGPRRAGAHREGDGQSRQSLATSR